MISIDVLAKVSYETAKISIPTIVDGLLKRVDPRVCDARLHSWAGGLLRSARVELETQGTENIVPGESYVVMSNHQSHFDIPVVFRALEIPVRMVAKAELFKIPVMGPAMKYAGFVELDRSKKTRALKALSKARDRLMRDGTSVWIAPEGTRSLDGELGEFKKGGFYMAIDAGLRILPVAIAGSLSVHRTQDLVVQKDQKVRVKVLPPVDPESFGKKKATELADRVRNDIATALAELK